MPTQPDTNHTSLRSHDDLKVKHNAALGPYTAARLGGPADILALVSSRDALKEVVRWAVQTSTSWLILGGGANVLISDAGVRGVVIINKAKQTKTNTQTGIVSADSGTTLMTLARHCRKLGLKGLEWAVNVPGTVGGAVVNNAGAHGADMNSNLTEITVYDADSDKEDTWPRAALAYDYRHSVLKGQHGRYVVLSATFALESKQDIAALEQEAETYTAHRKRTQPPGASLGSVFMNPPDDYAGRLIEAAGLKGYRVGGVAVSERHANFFVTDKTATANDYFTLIQHVQKTVAAASDVHLHLEIELLGEGFMA